ncbi:hypothetical protein Taro_034167, partial [Colocasia esculenta]|nr:hypothetical protein [Colocasia esculenta]
IDLFNCSPGTTRGDDEPEHRHLHHRWLAPWQIENKKIMGGSRRSELLCPDGRRRAAAMPEAYQWHTAWPSVLCTSPPPHSLHQPSPASL